MPPRPYCLGQRQITSDKTKSRIISAARKLLRSKNGHKAFSIDAVAKAARVTRVTVYHSFHSRTGLITAVFDHLALAGQLHRIPSIFQIPDPKSALCSLITIFTDFWNSDRATIRRVHALAVLDHELRKTLLSREERRRSILRMLLMRILHTASLPASRLDEKVDLLHLLTSFETFDRLAAPSRAAPDVSHLLHSLAMAITEDAF